MKTPESPVIKRRKIIAVIGDASCPEDSNSPHIARELGRLLIDAGYRVLTGGRGGVMEAVAQGARGSIAYASGDTIGILPENSTEQANAFVDIAIPTGLGFARNSIVAHSDAVIAIGGGAGTLSEMCYAWMHKRLLIALGDEGWAGRLAGERLDRRVRFRSIPEDRIYRAQTPSEAVQLTNQLLPVYQPGEPDAE